MTKLWRNARIATLVPPSGWGLVEDGALLTEGAALRWVGPQDALPAGLQISAEHDLQGALVTPGLDRKSTRLNSSHERLSRMPSSA